MTVAPIAGLLDLILSVAYFVMLIHIIMSWLINFNVLNLGQQFVAQVWYGLNRMLEPVYRPVRNVLPNTHPLDLAPLVVFILVIWMRGYVVPRIPF
ncbi:MAG: YggT family protein [Cognatishimia sp.]